MRKVLSAKSLPIRRRIIAGKLPRRKMGPKLDPALASSVSVSGLGGWLHSLLPSREVVIREIQSANVVNQGSFYTRVAGLSGALAVAMGAYGAHAFRPDDDPDRHRIFDTAYRYHILHSIALLSVPLTRKPMLVGFLMTSGMVVFSGSCYYHALTGDTRFRKITPFGGLLLIASWLSIIL